MTSCHSLLKDSLNLSLGASLWSGDEVAGENLPTSSHTEVRDRTHATMVISIYTVTSVLVSGVWHCGEPLYQSWWWGREKRNIEVASVTSDFEIKIYNIFSKWNSIVRERFDKIFRLGLVCLTSRFCVEVLSRNRQFGEEALMVPESAQWGTILWTIFHTRKKRPYKPPISTVTFISAFSATFFIRIHKVGQLILRLDKKLFKKT